MSKTGAKPTLTPFVVLRLIRIGYKYPWLNAVVERFHQSLDDELLRYVQPLNDRHLNRLLAECSKYYNTACTWRAVMNRQSFRM